jgi:hypothetical protein
LIEQGGLANLFYIDEVLKASNGQFVLDQMLSGGYMGGNVSAKDFLDAVLLVEGHTGEALKNVHSAGRHAIWKIDVGLSLKSSGVIPPMGAPYSARAAETAWLFSPSA